MHGVIFTSFRDFLSATYDAATAQRVFTDKTVYLLSESYPDRRFVTLLERACADTGADAGTMLHDFGVFTAETTFARLYPAFFAIAPSAREFLLTVETRIHELVRATIPNAQPPQLHISEHGPAGISVVYSSSRKLCVLLRGLAEGTARHYGETAAFEEPTCMHRGDSQCTFNITLSQAA